ncbi:MAG: MFS transporter [Eubacteriales bacterium]|nr:MFS transporter [Eubacteriales bacterium]
MDRNLKKYVVFWLSQSVSQLGSAMTGFALILWVYTVNHSAFTVSLMSFCNYVPYIIVSLFAGTFVDRHSKKGIMLTADSVAAVCSAFVLIMGVLNGLQIWHIYFVNGIIGFINAFQGPASSVAIGRIVPKDKLANASGMESFSRNLSTVLAPVLASCLFAWSGMKAVLLIDLCSFAVAFLVLLFVIPIPENEEHETERKSVFSGVRAGYAFLAHNRGILTIVVTLAVLNFFSRLTYENILSPMILARSGNNSLALGIVNAAMGIGGIAGGMIVSTGKVSKNSVKMIYVSAFISFLFGDLLMGAGRNTAVWTIAAVAASLPIPFINAGQNVILYQNVPDEMQGRVFSARNAIQYGTIPVGILLGGFLADYVFEPLMQSENIVTAVLHGIVGKGAGSGMAAMFLCTGILGSLFSLIAYRRKEIREMERMSRKGESK